MWITQFLVVTVLLLMVALVVSLWQQAHLVGSTSIQADLGAFNRRPRVLPERQPLVHTTRANRSATPKATCISVSLVARREPGRRLRRSIPPILAAQLPSFLPLYESMTRARLVSRLLAIWRAMCR